MLETDADVLCFPRSPATRQCSCGGLHARRPRASYQAPRSTPASPPTDSRTLTIRSLSSRRSRARRPRVLADQVCAVQP
eukprot:1380221-Rhodomonas_salina.2